MKIAYIVTRADPLGGVQVHIRDLAVALQEQGHQCTVIMGGMGPFVEQLRAHHVPTVILRHLVFPISPLSDIRALHEIRTVLRELRPNLLAAHSSKAGILGRLAGRSLGIPVVLTAHGWNFTPGIPRVQATMYRLIERSAGYFTNRIITVSEFDRQLTLEARVIGPDRVVTVHNGIPDLAPSLRADPARTPPRLVMVARFSPQKDHPTLLHALAGLKEYAWELDLVGDGPLLDEVKRLAASLGLNGRLRFLGQRTDVHQLLAQAQICLLVSNWEGFPISILEAMRARLPVVASSVAGIAESVQDGETGYLVPKGDVQQLRDKLALLLRDADLRSRLGASGRSRYEQHFTLSHAVTKTLRVYQDVLAEQPGSRAERPRSPAL